jgi:hypothetical protein
MEYLLLLFNEYQISVIGKNTFLQWLSSTGRVIHLILPIYIIPELRFSKDKYEFLVLSYFTCFILADILK